MKTYLMSVSWNTSATIEIKANSPEEARNMAEKQPFDQFQVKKHVSCHAYAWKVVEPVHNLDK